MTSFPSSIAAGAGAAATSYWWHAPHLPRAAGIGLGQDSVGKLAKNANKGQSGRRWKKCKVLIVDEVSMIDGGLFTKLEAIARSIRGSTKPFGGIQLVRIGCLSSFLAGAKRV